MEVKTQRNEEATEFRWIPAPSPRPLLTVGAHQFGRRRDCGAISGAKWGYPPLWPLNPVFGCRRVLGHK